MLNRLRRIYSSNPGAVRELGIIAVLAAVAFVAAYMFMFFDRVLRPAVAGLGLNGGLFAAGVVVVIGVAIFAVRRWREADLATAQTRRMFDEAVEGIFQSTPDGRYIQMNPAHARMFGYSAPAEMIAAITDIGHQIYVQPERRVEFVREMELNGQVRNFESNVYRKDGTSIWVLGNAWAERDAGGRILYFEGNLQDVTARIQAEAAYRDLVDHSLQGIAILRDQRIIFCNQAFADMLGYTREELVTFTAQDTAEHVHPDDRPTFLERMQDLLAGKSIPSRYVISVRQKRGEWRWIEANISRVEYGGKPAVLATVVDVTERVRSQEAMQQNLQLTRQREQVSAALARAGNDLFAVLNTLARIVARTLGDLCVVALVSSDGKWLLPVAYAHERPERQAYLTQILKETRVSATEPFLKRVVEEGQPLLIPEVPSDVLEQLQTPEYRDYIRAYGMRSYLMVPIRLGSQTIGTLGVSRENSSQAYTTHDQTLLQDLADRAALAITNAQLVHQLQSELEARRQAETKYRTLVEQIPAITYIASSDNPGEITYISPQIERLGYSQVEWTGTPGIWASRVLPDDLPHVNAAQANANANGQPLLVTYRIRAKDGSLHHIHDESVVVREEQDGSWFRQGVMLDVSREKLEQETALAHGIPAAAFALAASGVAVGDDKTSKHDSALAAGPLESPLLLRALIENMVDLTIMLNADGKILYATPVVERTYGYTPEELVGRSFEEFVHPEEMEFVRSSTRTMLENPGRVIRFDPVRVRTAGGEWRLVEGWGVSRLEQPDIHALLFNVRDITDQVSQERARVHAEAAEREQRALAEALRDAAALVNRAADSEQVLDGILDVVGRIVPFDSASIFLREGDRLRLVRARGFEQHGPTEWVEEFSYSANIPKFRTILEMGMPILISDTATASDWIDVPETRWIRSHITAPMAIGGAAVGLLGLDSATPGFYREEHGTQLMAFANLAAAALRNARLLSETERRAEQLSLLYDVGLTLNRVLDSSSQFEFLFQIARRALRAERMSFFKYNVAAETLAFELGVGVPPAVEDKLRASPVPISSPNSVIAGVARDRLPALLPDVELDPRWQRHDPIVRSVVAVPVEHEQELRGVLVAASPTRGAFSAQDERLLILFANQIAAAMQLTHLFQAQQQRQSELETLHEASLKFTAMLDRELLVTLILDYALRLVAADNAHLYFYQDDRLEFGGMMWGKDGPTVAKHYAPRPQGLTMSVARGGERLVVDDVNSHALFDDWKWGGAIVGLPLRSEGRVCAVMNVAYTRPHRFGSEELRALELLADHAAVALENARHAAEIQQQLHHAQLLHRAGEALNQTLSFEETVHRLTHFFIEGLDVEECCVLALDPAADEMRVILDHDALEETRLEPGTLLKLSYDTHVRRVLESKSSAAYRRDDPNLDPQIAKTMKEYLWESLLALPLRAGNEVIGLIELADHSTGRDFTPDQIRLAESLAHQAASALQNARLYEETKNRADHLTLLNRLAYALGRARTLDELLGIVERETLTLLPADSFFIALYESEKNEVEFRRFVDSGTRLDPFRWPLGPSLTRQVIQSRHALRLNARSQTAAPDNPRQYYGNGGVIHSWLGAPMRSGDRVGLISLQSTRPNAFAQADEQLLQTIADQAAIAVDRVGDAAVDLWI